MFIRWVSVVFLAVSNRVIKAIDLLLSFMLFAVIFILKQKYLDCEVGLKARNKAHFMHCAEYLAFDAQCPKFN